MYNFLAIYDVNNRVESEQMYQVVQDRRSRINGKTFRSILISNRLVSIKPIFSRLLETGFQLIFRDRFSVNFSIPIFSRFFNADSKSRCSVNFFKGISWRKFCQNFS